MITILSHTDCKINRLEKSLSVNTRKNETCLIKSFRTFCTRTDTYCRDWLADRCIKRRFLWKCTTITDYTESIHLKTIVIMKAKRLYLYPRIKFETRSLQAIAGARVTTIKNWHIILICHSVDSSEK